MQTWEIIVLLLMAGGVTYFFFPGIKTMLKQSEEAEKDWPAVLIPLGLVVLFIMLLISLV
jgi:hypothetical protein